MEKENIKKTALMVMSVISFGIAAIILLSALLKVILYVLPISALGLAFFIVYKLYDQINSCILNEKTKIAEACGENFHSDEELMKAVKVRRKGIKKTKYTVSIYGENVEINDTIKQILTETESNMENIINDFFAPINDKIDTINEKLEKMNKMM